MDGDEGITDSKSSKSKSKSKSSPLKPLPAPIVIKSKPIPSSDSEEDTFSVSGSDLFDDSEEDYIEGGMEGEGFNDSMNTFEDDNGFTGIGEGEGENGESEVIGIESTSSSRPSGSSSKRLKQNDVGEGEEGVESKRRRRRHVQADSEEDEEYVGDEEIIGSNERKRKQRRGSKSTSRKPRRERRQSSIIEDSPPPSKARSRKSNSTTASTSTSTEITSVPITERTRAHCIKTLTSSFISIFSASSELDSTEIESKSNSFAILVESELFDSLAEVDLTTGIKAPRTKYTTKFRSLVYNLKSNASFRSSINSSSLSPHKIVNMTNEDLLTPELKAMAESVRAASLKHSVKEVISAPTAKRTHKGEIEIENYAKGVIAEEERMLEKRELLDRERKARERSNSITSIAPSPIIPDSYAFGSTDLNNDREEDEEERVSNSNTTTAAFSGSPTITRPRNSLPSVNVSNLADDLDLSFDQDETSTTPSKLSISLPQEEIEPSGSMLPPPTPTSIPSTSISTISPMKEEPKEKTSFNMASVWGNVKSDSTLDTTSMDITEDVKSESSKEEVLPEEEEEEDFDPFAISSRIDNEDEDFETSLLRDESIPIKSTPSSLPLKSALSSKSVSTSTPKSTTPPLPPPTSVPIVPLSELPPIWAGDLLVPEEGGFPAFGVQVGGRYFGTSYDIWNQLLPKGLTMSGRLPTITATKYLIECCFASSRELVVLVLLPDLTGPSQYFPNKPIEEKCLKKFSHVVNFYIKKDRIGVITPSGNLKKVVRDIYIVPLKKDEILPEYIELLDDHNIPETGTRDRDLLLAVLVIQKGIIPSCPRPLSPSLLEEILPIENSIPTSIPFTSEPPHASTSISQSQSYSIPHQPLPSTTILPIPPFDPTSLQSLLQSNPTALSSLNSLLSNPNLLQSVLNTTTSTNSINGLSSNLSQGDQINAVLAGLSSVGLPTVSPSITTTSNSSISNNNNSTSNRGVYQNGNEDYSRGNRNDEYNNNSSSNSSSRDRYQEEDSRFNNNKERERERDNQYTSNSPPTISESQPPPPAVRQTGAFVHPSRMGLVAGTESNNSNSNSNWNSDSRSTRGGGSGSEYRGRGGRSSEPRRDERDFNEERGGGRGGRGSERRNSGSSNNGRGGRGGNEYQSGQGWGSRGGSGRGSNSNSNGGGDNGW